MDVLQDYYIDLSRIKPNNIRKSDKYSKEIYKYLKNNPQYRRVWFDDYVYDSDSEQYIRRAFDPENMNLDKLYFGIPDRNNSVCITGNSINNLIVGGRGSQETSYYIGFENSHYVEVTKEFYEKYIEIGRCIYGHRRYLTDTDERFTYINDKHRKCNWCGKEQHEEIIEYTYESRKWVND